MYTRNLLPKFALLILTTIIPLTAFSQQSQLDPISDIAVPDQNFSDDFKPQESVSANEVKVFYTSRKYCFALYAYLDDIAFTKGWMEQATDEEVNSVVKVGVASLSACHSPQAAISPKVHHNRAEYFDSSAPDVIEHNGKTLNRAKVKKPPAEPGIEVLVYLGSTTTTFTSGCWTVVTNIDYYYDTETGQIYVHSSSYVIMNAESQSCASV